MAPSDFQDLAARYDRWYQTPLGAFAHALEQEAIVGLADVKPGSRAIDIGCGAGIYALELARRGVRVVGVDTSFEMLAIAREKFRAAGLPGFWVCGSAEALPLRSASADLAVAVTSLCFVSEPARALAPGGRVVIGELHRWSSWALVRRLKGLVTDTIYNQAHFWGRRELERLLRRNGLVPTRRARRPSSSPHSKRRVPQTGTQGGTSAQAAPPRGGSVYRHRGGEAAMRPETMEAAIRRSESGFDTSADVDSLSCSWIGLFMDQA